MFWKKVWGVLHKRDESAVCVCSSFCPLWYNREHRQSHGAIQRSFKAALNPIQYCSHSEPSWEASVAMSSVSALNWDSGGLHPDFLRESGLIIFRWLTLNIQILSCCTSIGISENLSINFPVLQFLLHKIRKITHSCKSE